MTDQIVKTVDLKAPIDRVWRAITDHGAFGEWFQVHLEQPFVVGQITYGQITAEGHEHMVWVSRTEVLEPETRFVFSWCPGPEGRDFDYDSQYHMHVEFRFEPIDSGTRLIITESGFDGLPAQDRDAMFRQNEEGWTAQCTNIRGYVDA